MTFAKAQVYKEDKLDNDARLLCTTPGCGKRWSVNMGSPKCSFHQWGRVADVVSVKSQLPKLEKPADMDAWWQK
jgi:hypothetical protein